QAALGEHRQGLGGGQRGGEAGLLQLEDVVVQAVAGAGAEGGGAQGPEAAVDEETLGAVQAVDGVDLAGGDGAEDVLLLPRGHGPFYNTARARARNLHRAARVIARSGFPADEEALRALPGVGPYTAAVLAAIVLGARTFALDGNAARVAARLGSEARPIDRPGVRVALRAFGE